MSKRLRASKTPPMHFCFGDGVLETHPLLITTRLSAMLAGSDFRSEGSIHVFDWYGPNTTICSLAEMDTYPNRYLIAAWQHYLRQSAAMMTIAIQAKVSSYRIMAGSQQLKSRTAGSLL